MMKNCHQKYASLWFIKTLAQVLKCTEKYREERQDSEHKISKCQSTTTLSQSTFRGQYHQFKPRDHLDLHKTKRKCQFEAIQLTKSSRDLTQCIGCTLLCTLSFTESSLSIDEGNTAKNLRDDLLIRYDFRVQTTILVPHAPQPIQHAITTILTQLTLSKRSTAIVSCREEKNILY